MSILITFAMGVVAGVYIYFTGFTAIVYNLTVSDEERSERFVVVAESYGGCRAKCPSFQVQADGAYRYLFTPEVGQPEALREGEISGGLRRDLRRSLTIRTLEEQSQEVTPESCESYTDGIDVRYEITLDGNEYEIDSCGTNVDWNSSLWVTLNELWQEVSAPGNN